MRSLITILALVFSLPAIPCSVFYIEGSDGIVAKNLDWFSGEGRIIVNQRGLNKKAILIDSTLALEWTSRFSSVTISGNAREFPWEGMNEAGVSAHILELPWSEASPKTLNLPTVGSVQWVQYILDTSANLSEAIENALKVRISEGLKLHYFVCDVSSNCATFEYINAKLIVHTGSQLPMKALTNDTYESSLAYATSLLGQSQQSILYDRWSVASLARFSRAAIWSKNFSPAKETALGHAFVGLNNLVEIIPATTNTPSWRTYWSMAFNLKTRTLYWRTVASPEIKSVSLLAFNPNCHSSVMSLDVNAPGSGDMTPFFSEFNARSQNLAVDTWVRSLPPNQVPSSYSINAIKNYPTSLSCGGN